MTPEDGAAVNIFLVSDSRTIECSIRQRLNSFPHTLSVTTHGRDVVSQLTAAKPDVCLLQADLDELSGIGICGEIVENPETQHVPVILISPGEEFWEKAKQAGARALLNIPFGDDDLVQSIRRCLSSKKSILVVDDSVLIHKAVGEILEAQGYQVLHAMDGVEGLRMLERHRPDVIISDIEMPNMNGYQFCSAVKTNSKTADIPLIFQSSLSGGIDIDRGFDAGADDYITKPVDPQELLSRVKAIVNVADRSGRETILVVDDSPVVRNMIVNGLCQQGFNAVTADNGKEALERLPSIEPAMILTDNEMPVMDGIEFVRGVRKMADYLSTPIIMLSGRDSKGERTKGRIAGVTEYLSKPFTVDKLLVFIERLMAENRLRREKDAMRLYMSDAALAHASEVARKGGQAGQMRAQERPTTILFSDIAGFTPLCEKLTPREIVLLLNEYFDVMVGILKKNEAVIDKFIGDAIMALFPGNEAGTYKAVRAGFDMVESLKVFNAQHDRQIHMRVGINTGSVVMGDLGSKYYRRDFTVIGDTVNLAQRLESKAPRDGVLISDATYRLVRDVSEVETLEPIQVKGKEEKVLCHVVKSLKDVKI